MPEYFLTKTRVKGSCPVTVLSTLNLDRVRLYDVDTSGLLKLIGAVTAHLQDDFCIQTFWHQKLKNSYRLTPEERTEPSTVYENKFRL